MESQTNYFLEQLLLPEIMGSQACTVRTLAVDKMTMRFQGRHKTKEGSHTRTKVMDFSAILFAMMGSAAIPQGSYITIG